MAVGVARDGNMLLHKGYGVRNVKKGQLITPKTSCSIASISKTFASLPAALLVDASKLRRDHTVG
jgi:CubicO group peptidase (beta-lactamase class C family)